MVETASLGEMVPAIPKVSVVLNVTLMILVTILLLAAIAFIFWKLIARKKYNQYKVEIWDRDNNGNVYKEYDRAGVFLNKKTNMKLLWLEKFKVGLDPNNPPYTSTIVKDKIIKTIALQRIGVNNYIFLKFNVSPDKVEITVGEEDKNNAAHEMTKIRKTYDKESWLKKMAPVILGLIVLIIVSVVLIVLANKITIMQEVATTMLTITDKQVIVTELLKNVTINTGTNPTMPIIVPGG